MTIHPYPQLEYKINLLKTKQRQVQRRYLYRSLVVSLFAGSTIGIAISNSWYIKEQSQINFIGNRLIDSNAIADKLGISYPQSIVTLPSQKIENKLESISALQSVQVSKTIFPPAMKIYLQERIPVATALSLGKIGFLDAQGEWLEPDLYHHRHIDRSSTTIKAVNFQPQDKTTWSEIYSLITAYPHLNIKEVHWQEGGNLLLVTDRFEVILGTDRSVLKPQFASLANFPDVSSNKALQNIVQIDLTNPNAPFLVRNSSQ